MLPNGIGLNAVAILIDMAKWTWEALMRTETTLQTESLPLRFSPCYKSGWRKIKAPSGTHRSYLRQLAYNVSGLCVVALSINLKLTTTLDRAITQNPCYVPFLFRI